MKRRENLFRHGRTVGGDNKNRACEELLWVNMISLFWWDVINHLHFPKRKIFGEYCQAITYINLGMIPLIVTPCVGAEFQRSCVLPLPLRVRFIKPLNCFRDCLSNQRSEERKQINRRGNQKRFPSRRFMNQRTPSPATMPTGAVGRGSKSGLTIIRYLKTSTLKKKKGT